MIDWSFLFEGPSETMPKVIERPSLMEFVRRDAQSEDSLGLLLARCPKCRHESGLTVTVNDEAFHCSVCEFSGDIFTWIQETRGLSFREAFNWLILHSGARYQIGDN